MLTEDSIGLHLTRPPRPLPALLPLVDTAEQAAAPSPADTPTPEKLVLMVSGSPGDAQRYRCTNKLEEFEYLGLTADSVTSEQLHYKRDLGRYEMFLLHRVQNSPQLEDFIRRAKVLGKPVVFDSDDLVFDGRAGRLSPTTRYMGKHELELHKNYVYRTGRTLEQCDAAIVSTECLRDCILELFPGKTVYLHRNAASQKFVDLANTVRAEYVRPDSDLVRIAYVSGSKTHKDDFAQCVLPIRRLLEKYPQVRLMCVGHVEIPAEVRDFPNQVEAVPPVPWYHVPLCYAMVDINLAPLELNHKFTESKSELKYFEAALMGLPTVASDIAPFRAGITRGETGFLCGNDEEWFDALERLVLDSELRVQIGKAAYADALNRYTTRVRSRQLKPVLQEILGPKRPL
jgi:glycosyltransferase involved in cell wall biosynthesis